MRLGAADSNHRVQWPAVPQRSTKDKWAAMSQRHPLRGRRDHSENLQKPGSGHPGPILSCPWCGYWRARHLKETDSSGRTSARYCFLDHFQEKDLVAGLGNGSKKIRGLAALTEQVRLTTL